MSALEKAMGLALLAKSSRTKSQAQDELMVLVANSGVPGLVRLPLEDDECHRVSQRYEEFINQRENQVGQLVKERTADEGIQEEICEALALMLLNAKRPYNSQAVM